MHYYCILLWLFSLLLICNTIRFPGLFVWISDVLTSSGLDSRTFAHTEWDQTSEVSHQLQQVHLWSKIGFHFRVSKLYLDFSKGFWYNATLLVQLEKIGTGLASYFCTPGRAEVGRKWVALSTGEWGSGACRTVPAMAWTHPGTGGSSPREWG